MIVPETEIPSLLDIEERLETRRNAGLPILRVAVLRNITVESIEPYLKYLADESGYAADIRFGEFDNIVQEALGSAPTLFGADLDAVLLFAPLIALSPQLESGFPLLSRSEIDAEVERLLQLFDTVSRGIRSQTDAMILWHGLESPLYPAMGILDAQMPYGQEAIIGRLNDALRAQLMAATNAYLVNIDACLSRLGANRFYDARYWQIARAPYAREGLAEIAREDFKFLRALKGRARKCLVLDCDNTLWGGIIGEDGLDGIALAQSHPGKAYVDFQQEVLSLHRRGVILALCSKNNESDVWDVFAKHPDMVLRREHVAAARINWSDKASNLKELAAELNIGVDSLVFVDDSDFEINLIRERLPEVQVIQLPTRRPADYRWILASSGLFDLLQLTAEDRARGELYQTEARRRQARSEGVSMDDYCRSLNMNIEIGIADSYSIPRIVQQTQKTNQFNLTTRRYSEADVARFAGAEEVSVYWLKVSDRFGDMGIVGTCILRFEGAVAIIDTLLLSCRALGRGIEQLFLREMLRAAFVRGARRVFGQYLPTTKNAQVADFFPRLGFLPVVVEDTQGQWYFLNLSQAPANDTGVFAAVRTSFETTVGGRG